VQSTLGVSLRLERYCVDYTKRAQNAALQTQRFQRSCRMARSLKCDRRGSGRPEKLEEEEEEERAKKM
jgi:hypothetical protein